MDERKYEDLVGVYGSHAGVKESLRKFRDAYPNLPIVINTTCIRGINAERQDLVDMVDFAKSLDASIKILELFPSDLPGTVKLPEIGSMLEGIGFTLISDDLRKRRYSDGQTSVALTRIFCSEAIGTDAPASFCNENNDLFISPDGQAKPCREDMMEIDFNPSIMSRDENAMAGLIGQAFAAIGTKCVYA